MIPARSPSSLGMTLIEMLVVLAIVAVVAMVSALALGSATRLDVQTEARRLSARVQLAADQSMLGDQAMALSLGRGGYGFVEWDDGRADWQQSRSGPLAEWHTLPRGLTLTSSNGRAIVPVTTDGAADGVTFTLSDKASGTTVLLEGLTVRVSGAVSAP